MRSVCGHNVLHLHMQTCGHHLHAAHERSFRRWRFPCAKRRTEEWRFFFAVVVAPEVLPSNYPGVLFASAKGAGGFAGARIRRRDHQGQRRHARGSCRRVLGRCGVGREENRVVIAVAVSGCCPPIAGGMMRRDAWAGKQAGRPMASAQRSGYIRQAWLQFRRASFAAHFHLLPKTNSNKGSPLKQKLPEHISYRLESRSCICCPTPASGLWLFM